MVPAGARLGRYELLARIASGGMGEIFLARFEGAAGFEKLCVIKRILPHLADDERFRHMLIDEARIAAALSHPNICHVFELEETDHQLYIVMEYLQGATLLALLRKFGRAGRPLDLGLIGGVVAQSCAGLHYAHEFRDHNGERLEVVHRDVTPSNIFLTDNGVVKVHDFGVAKVRNTANTETGTLKGKFAYMAPEQIQAGPVDRRVDVYAMGVVLAEMMTGRPLFKRKTEYLTFEAVMTCALPDFGARRSDLPDGLTDVVRKALARNPEDRFATVRQLGAAVHQTLAGTPIWSQAQIGELVELEFADEMEQHNAQIASVVGRLRSGSMRTMPLFAPPDDGDEYSSIETGVANEPIAPTTGAGHPSRTSPAPSQPIPLGHEIEPRFGPSAIGIVAAAALAVIAIGWVAIGGGDGGASTARRGAATGPHAAYDDVIRTHDDALARCADASAPPAPGARVTLGVGADGHIASVTFEPDAVGRSPMASCIRDVLDAVAFPPGEEREVSLALTLGRD